MKARRFTVIIVSVVLTAVGVCFALVAHWQRSQPVFKDAPKLISAAHAFSRDQVARGNPVPVSVSLRELVSGGYIATNDVRAFDGMEVTISLVNEADPQAVLIRVRLPDGTQVVAMADGSVQQLAK